jgi:hypothetical protein
MIDRIEIELLTEFFGRRIEAFEAIDYWLWLK